jgi:hypothetical protein
MNTQTNQPTNTNSVAGVQRYRVYADNTVLHEEEWHHGPPGPFHQYTIDNRVIDFILTGQ